LFIEDLTFKIALFLITPQVNLDILSVNIAWEFATLQKSVVSTSSEVVKHNYRSSHLPDDVDAFKFSKFSHLYFQVCNALHCNQPPSQASPLD
jgi:hypothetical protein